MTETGRLHKIEYHMQQKGAENVEQAKNTILLVRGTAAEPAALSAFTAAQPDVQLQTISGLDEAGAEALAGLMQLCGRCEEVLPRVEAACRTCVSPTSPSSSRPIWPIS